MGPSDICIEVATKDSNELRESAPQGQPNPRNSANHDSSNESHALHPRVVTAAVADGPDSCGYPVVGSALAYGEPAARPAVLARCRASIQRNSCWMFLALLALLLAIDASEGPLMVAAERTLRSGAPIPHAAVGTPVPIRAISTSNADRIAGRRRRTHPKRTARSVLP